MAVSDTRGGITVEFPNVQDSDTENLVHKAADQFGYGTSLRESGAINTTPSPATGWEPTRIQDFSRDIYGDDNRLVDETKGLTDQVKRAIPSVFEMIPPPEEPKKTEASTKKPEDEALKKLSGELSNSIFEKGAVNPIEMAKHFYSLIDRAVQSGGEDTSAVVQTIFGLMSGGMSRAMVPGAVKPGVELGVMGNKGGRNSLVDFTPKDIENIRWLSQDLKLTPGDIADHISYIKYGESSKDLVSRQHIIYQLQKMGLRKEKARPTPQGFKKDIQEIAPEIAGQDAQTIMSNPAIEELIWDHYSSGTTARSITSHLRGQNEDITVKMVNDKINDLMVKNNQGGEVGSFGGKIIQGGGENPGIVKLPDKMKYDIQAATQKGELPEVGNLLNELDAMIPNMNPLSKDRKEAIEAYKSLIAREDTLYAQGKSYEFLPIEERMQKAGITEDNPMYKIIKTAQNRIDDAKDTLLTSKNITDKRREAFEKEIRVNQRKIDSRIEEGKMYAKPLPPTVQEEVKANTAKMMDEGNRREFEVISGGRDPNKPVTIENVVQWLRDAGVEGINIRKGNKAASYIEFPDPIGDILKVRIPADKHIGKVRNDERGKLFDTGTVKGDKINPVTDYTPPNSVTNVSNESYSQWQTLIEALKYKLSKSPDGNWLISPDRAPRHKTTSAGKTGDTISRDPNQMELPLKSKDPNDLALSDEVRAQIAKQEGLSPVAVIKGRIIYEHPDFKQTPFDGPPGF